MTDETKSAAPEPTKAAPSKILKMPAAEVIHKRLLALGFDHFLEKSKLHESLGDQDKYPEGVALAVDLAIFDYCDPKAGNGGPMVAMLMQMRKQEIVDALCK